MTETTPGSDGLDKRSQLSVMLDLTPYVLLILGLVVFYLAPYNLLRGNADSVWTFAAGLLGCGFWIYAAAILASAF